jgi:hypothetical protein
MFLTEDDDYPEGVPGQIAVCFWLRSETAWSFEIAKDRAAADEALRTASRDPAVLSVPLDRGAHKGAVAWMMQCDDSGTWRCIARTKGAAEHLDEVWFSPLLHSN